MRLPSGRSQLRVLLVSCAVRYCCAPDQSRRAADDAEPTTGQRGAAEGEETTRAWKRERPPGRKQKGSGRAEHTESNAKALGRRNVPSIPPRPGTGENERRRGDPDATGDTADGEGESVDVPGYVPTPEELRLREVYGDWVHGNPVTHLDGGVKDDSAWQAWWCDLTIMLSRRYDAPSGKVGRRFVGTLGVEMQGVQDRRWN